MQNCDIFKNIGLKKKYWKFSFNLYFCNLFFILFLSFRATTKDINMQKCDKTVISDTK